MKYRKMTILLSSGLLCTILSPYAVKSYRVMTTFTPTENQIQVVSPPAQIDLEGEEDLDFEEDYENLSKTKESVKSKINQYLNSYSKDSEEVKNVKTDENKLSVNTSKNIKSDQKVKYELLKSYQTKISRLLDLAETYQKIPYVWGGTSKTNGMDCSGFVQHLYKQMGYDIPRVSKDQSKVGKLVSRKELKPGDLLFFDTRNPRDLNDIKTPALEMEYANAISNGFKPNVVSHVGMYVGDNMMIHASSGHGYITYESIDKNYYKVRFINARRIIYDERID